jgi:hypothetical protein
MQTARILPTATDIRGRIVEGVARTLTLCACADAIEEPSRFDFEPDADDLEQFNPGSGGDWDDSIPDGFPPEAFEKAQMIVLGFEVLNGRPAEDIGAEWDTLCDQEAEFEWSEEGPERFGHCLAMEYLGHGVGLCDDIPAGAKWPNGKPKSNSGEFYAWDFDMRKFLGIQ